MGTQKVLSIPGGVSRVAVGDPNVADVKTVGSNQMLVIGGQVGRTTLLVTSFRTSPDQKGTSLLLPSLSDEAKAGGTLTL